MSKYTICIPDLFCFCIYLLCIAFIVYSIAVFFIFLFADPVKQHFNKLDSAVIQSVKEFLSVCVTGGVL